ncbi:MAG: hypothetical protein KGI90_11785 [Burkholderiales bacterium]|nr:hypothetical protein [Burkholderiales bacterium]
MAAAPLHAQTPAEKDNAALERAQRQADAPLRLILEAAKIQRTGVPAGGEATPAARPAPAAVTAPAERVLTASAALQAPRPGAWPELPPLPVATAAAAGDLPGAPDASLAALLVRPRLLSMVPPALPPQMLDELAGRVAPVAALTIEPDGRVSAVAVLPPAPNALLRYLRPALLQWRYAPLPAQQVLRVELDFKNL